MNIEFNLEYNEEEKKYEILKTIVEIMIKRKKLDNDNDNLKILIKNFKKDDEYETFIELNNKKKLIIKMIYLEKLSKINDLEDFLLNNIDYDIFLIVNKNSMTAKVYNGIEKIKDNNPELNVELFKDTELIFNILECNLVPDHILLDKNEKNKFILDYDINESNMFRELPKIYDIDIICRYLDAKHGDILKIINVNQVSGYGIHYRIVIKGKMFDNNKKN